MKRNSRPNWNEIDFKTKMVTQNVKKIGHFSASIWWQHTMTALMWVLYNSTTNHMAQRLLEMKADINAVLSESDKLSVSEWTKLEEMTDLSAPFSAQTDILQSNSLSSSLVLPSVMDMECHLQQLSNSTSSEPLTMLADWRSRFPSLLCPSPALQIVTGSCLPARPWSSFSKASRSATRRYSTSSYL